MWIKILSGTWRRCGLVLLLLTIGLPALQADQAQNIREIEHLMDYIGASSCRFIRNGKIYDAAAARSHIRKKYDYLRERIRTAEDFIRYAATESSTSGEPYRIRCGAQEMLCADWLAAEIRRYRLEHAPPADRDGGGSSS
jgi:hypothetical protein